MRKALESAMAKNELLMALGEAPRKPVYLVGQIGNQQVSMHGEKGRMVIQTPDGRAQEMELAGMGAGSREVEDGRGREGGEKEAGIQGRPMEEEKKRLIKTLGMISTMGISFAVAITIGVYVGLKLDEWFGTGPWFFFIFLLFGIAAGFRNIYIMANREIKRDDDGKDT